MIKKTVTWYLVADGARGRVFANEGPGKGLHAAIEKDFVLDRKAYTRDIVSDREGRTVSTTRGGRHTLGADDPHTYEETEFLRHVADEIAAAGQQGRFDRLVIVAAPRALGDLRAHLPRAAKDKVSGELDKDLTRLSEADLAKHLEAAGLLR